MRFVANSYSFIKSSYNYVILIVITMLLLGCNGQPPPPSWFPKIYVGDSRLKLVIASDKSKIMCEEAKFDNLVCMDKDEIENQIRDRNKLIEACLRWKE